MPKATDEVRQQIRDKYPGRDDIEIIRHPRYEDEAVARPPTEAEWRIFRQKATAGGQEAAQALDVLIDSCILWPDKDGRAEVFKRRPGLREVWAGEITEMAGTTSRATREKF